MCCTTNDASHQSFLHDKVEGRSRRFLDDITRPVVEDGLQERFHGLSRHGLRRLGIRRLPAGVQSLEKTLQLQLVEVICAGDWLRVPGEVAVGLERCEQAVT